MCYVSLVRFGVGKLSTSKISTRIHEVKKIGKWLKNIFPFVSILKVVAWLEITN